jgi:hypothetical protein
MKMVYKYPINAFPYDELLSENGKEVKRNRNMKFSIPEFSIRMNILIFS